jgi:hypothetical protein
MLGSVRLIDFRTCYDTLGHVRPGSVMLGQFWPFQDTFG